MKEYSEERISSKIFASQNSPLLLKINTSLSNTFMRPLHGYFLPLFRSGATPLKPRFFFVEGVYWSFLCKKGRLFIIARNIFIFILFFVLYYFFETFEHSCKGLFYVIN
ncbi:hypothetical protein BREVNS_0717 [Brevinematales bacterium NS]|nr:hypothetical protein BREVNS_0717 [Brevinematales bacterium NS]